MRKTCKHNLSTQPRDNLTILKPAQRVQINDKILQQMQQHNKPGSTVATPPPKKSRSKPGSNATAIQRCQMDNEFTDLQSFLKTTDSEEAAGGGS
jgi:hypothetical protein